MKTHRPLHCFASHRASSAVDEPNFLATVLAFEMGGTADAFVAPEWVQIFPKGPEMATVDGRSFKMTDPQAFVDAQKTSSGTPILVDYDHLSSFLPEDGGDQTAAGWIDELEVRDGEVWAKVSWTVRAAKQIKDREWRFLSPEFLVSKKTKEIAKLSALSLVNRPAFQMTALARAQKTQTGDPDMKTIAKALGLPDDATEAQILAAIRANETELATVKASKITPSTNDFMPRADYDRVLARATDAETAMNDLKSSARRDEVEMMIASAVAAGKISPASKGHYVFLASANDAGFEEIKKLTETLPKITAVTNLGDKDAGAGGLSDEDKHMAATLGVSEEAFAKQLARDKS